ncbi:MAG: hypothetical protein P9X22_02885 [Candidatus Zapsychrus exili]|nr:hypothetical protein [Candidatus Zapsychrus exili]
MYTSIGALFLANYTTFYFIKDKKYYLILRRLFIIIPFVIFFIQFTHYKHIRVNKENHGGGFWKMQRNWEHMQKIVRENTPKDSLLLVPYNLEMGGFRILSERKIIASYRDCGIIGFDYPATLSWKERIRDIKNFKFLVKESTASAIKNAILKYNVDYIVFMRYAAPKEDNSILKHIYSNEIFSLFKVIANQ